MFKSSKFRLAAVLATMAFAFAASTGTAAAQGVGTAGLVNVVVVDGVDIGNIQVPVSVAANVCDVNAAVLVQEFVDEGDADCTATTTSLATSGGQGNGGQGGPFVGTAGLVNVVLVDVIDIGNVQVPVSVAANLCDVNVGVLVQEFRDDGTADCDSTADSRATSGPSQGGGNA